MLAVELAIVAGLIVVNGLLAMSELALVSAKRPLLEQMVRSGSRGAGVALDLMREPGRMLSAVQIGITLVGIVAGAFSGATIAERGDAWLESQDVPTRIAEPVAYVAVVVMITYLSVVLGELVPKQIGMRNAEQVAAIVARPMQILARGAAPVVILLDVSARLGLRLLGQSRPREAGVTDEEIKTMIDEAERSGVVEPEERSMISRVMRLADRSVRGVMTPRPDIEWLDLQDDDETIRQAIRASRHARILAANGDIDEVVGAIPVRAALVALMDGGVDAVRLLVQPVPVVSDRLGAIDVVEQLRQSPLNLVIVVDEHGSVEGIVSEGDILKTVVADIEEREEPNFTVRDDGSLLIDGSCPVDELGERLGILLPPDHRYHTVAGFVLDRMKRLPRIGESFSHGLWRFEVVDIDGTRIDKLLVTPQPALHRRA
ncbi:hemolysin family protein [Reyranella sp.]|uniref:hemolysin family protein n=1 Tax=Reyranella sp. TaxID=1929291 RepID=UPI0011F7D849|nr:hemolysin family protein [Reyranella sp.]TAJ88197.1 MAG: HlyC/CorC family transporter [Reyranella sp.]